MICSVEMRTVCKTLCVSLFADIIIRSSDIDLEFVKMLQHPSTATGGSNHRTILQSSDGTNHVVYNLHTMSPNANIISCDSIEETTVNPITPTDEDLTVESALDDDLNEFVICEKTDSKMPGTSSYNVVVVAHSPPTQNVRRPVIHDPLLLTVAPTASVSTAQLPAIAPSYAKDDAQADRDKFACPNCGSKFTALRNMKRHFQHECGIEPKHGCEFCPMRFKRRNLLKYHIVRKHSANK